MNNTKKKRKVLPRLVTLQEKLDYLSNEGFTIEERMINGSVRYTTIHRIDGMFGIQRANKKDFATFDEAFDYCEVAKLEFTKKRFWDNVFVGFWVLLGLIVFDLLDNIFIAIMTLFSVIFEIIAYLFG